MMLYLLHCTHLNHKVMILKDYQFLETSRDILDGAETLQDYVKTLISDS